MQRSANIICAAFALLLSLGFSSPSPAFTIQGAVQAEDGTPISNAQVWLSRSRVAHAQRTNSDGRFTFENIESGPIHVVVYADGLALGGIEGPCIRDEDVLIVLSPPQKTRIRVINRRFEPVEGARLSRLRVNDSFEVFPDDLAPFGFPIGRSDEQGFLDLPPLPRDAFISIIVSRTGYADGQLPALPVGIENLDFPLPDGIKVVGRITNRTGAGVPRARVSLYQPREGAAVLGVGEVLTGPDGFYTILVPPGAYYAAARHPEYAMPTPVQVEARELSGEVVANLEMREPHRIEGRALDVSGAPVPLVRLEYHAGDFVVDEAVTDVRGRYTLTVPEGQGAIHVTPPPRMTTTVFPRVYFAVSPVEPVIHPPAIEFRPLPDIAGRALAADGSPAGHALIRSLNLEPPRFYTADDGGEFTISLDEMPEDTLRFRIEHPLRFQKLDFEIDPIKLEATNERLVEYQPDVSDANARGVNDLSSLLGEPAPEFACTAWFNLPDGAESLSVAALQGKVVVLTLWAGFDFLGSSRYRAEELNATHRAYESVEDIVFVGIHDSTVLPDQVERMARQLGLTFPIGCDQAPYETFARYLTQQIPQTVLIDKRGLVRFYATEGRLVELIKVLRRE